MPVSNNNGNNHHRTLALALGCYLLNNYYGFASIINVKASWEPAMAQPWL